MTHRFDDSRPADARTGGDGPACDRLDELLPDYLEGALDPVDRAGADRHIAGCARCASLVADLERIAHDAAALPPLRPDRELWAGIETRIAPPVTSLDAHRARDARGRPSGARRWAGPAAAALVLVTSSLAILLGRSGEVAPPDAAPVAAADGARLAPAAPAGAATRDAAPPTVADVSPASDPGGGAPAPASAPRASGPPVPGGPASDARLARGGPAPAADEYDREIAALRGIVRERRTELDTGTVRVLEETLRVVDQAIARSRAALARDPNSRFLGDQLDRALESKLDLMRTVALLGPRGA